MKRILLLLLICLPVLMSAQKSGDYLNENFNKASISTFPPYGWRNVDADGDGRAWSVSGDGALDAEGNQTLSATSHTWLFQDLDPDNWLITPPLLVETETDSIKFWFGSYKGAPQQGRVYISTTGYEIADFTLLDEVGFNGTYNHVNRSISLKDYIGETIYIAFRHTKTEGAGIALALDNVTGPRIQPLDHDLTVYEISGFNTVSCDIEDVKPTITIDNLGSNPVNEFKVYYQSQGYITEQEGEEEHDHISFSPLFSETVTQTIPAGGSLSYECKTALPFSEYNAGTINIRAFIEYEQDAYCLNDTLETSFIKQQSLTTPFIVGFESGETNHQGWYMSPRSTSAPFSIGANPLWANTGNNYLTASVYAPLSGAPVTGDDAYAATRCLLLDENQEYRIDLAYTFRKFPVAQQQKKINFKLIMGTDQRNLLEDHVVLVDTVLVSDKPLISMNTQAEYDLFSSNYFSVPYSGTAFIGLVFYSDEPVAKTEDEWMVFLDDLYLVDRDFDRPIDLALGKINVAYDCNLTAEEPISFTVRNGSLKPSTEITAKYRVNNGEWITETFTETIQPNEQKDLTFSTTLNLSSYRKYKVEGFIFHEGEEELANNELMIVTENKRVKALPFVDDFEEYGVTLNFEDEYRIYDTGYYTWMAAYDQTGNQTYSYSGDGFLADAASPERFTAPDDWLVSCCLQFEKDKEYEISFAYRIESYNVTPSELKVYLLSSYDPSSVIETVGHLEMQNTSHKIFKARYTAKEDHIGHLAFHSCGGLGASVIMMDALSVKLYDGLGIDDVEASSLLSVYPNPASDYVKIESGDNFIRSVEIFNIVGKRMYFQEYADAVINPNIPLAGYEKGNYLVKVQLGSGEVIVKKLIVD